MNENLVNELMPHWKLKSTYELLTIWEENDRDRFVDEAFEATKRILQERGEAIGPQNEWVPKKPRNRLNCNVCEENEGKYLLACERCGKIKTQYLLLELVGPWIVLFTMFAVGQVYDWNPDLGFVGILLLLGAVYISKNAFNVLIAEDTKF